MTDETGALLDSDVVRVHRRTVALLVAGLVLGGLGFGTTMSTGALLISGLSGTPALSGMAATMGTLGAALAAIPLARLAQRGGRRVSLSTGALIAAAGAVVTVLAAAIAALPLVFLGILLIGMGNAANLQARFAATDLAQPQNRARDLSLVVWSTTIGAVIGPNLIGPGEKLGLAVGLPEMTGPFVFTLVTQVLAASVYLIGLRPDPLLLAARLRRERGPAPRSADRVNPERMRHLLIFAVVAVAMSQAAMVAVMAMTPVHLTEHGGSLTIVGITISLHVAGMFALSPLFGMMADRLGRVASILIGQALLAGGLAATAFGSADHGWVMVGLTLIGLGWSASTIAGAALVTESSAPEFRARNQGRSDLTMSLCGAVGGALAGPVMTQLGYPGLAFLAGVLVVVVVVSAAFLTRPATAV